MFLSVLIFKLLDIGFLDHGEDVTGNSESSSMKLSKNGCFMCIREMHFQMPAEMSSSSHLTLRHVKN